MKTIHKQQLDLQPEQILEFPKDSMFLTIQVQKGKPQIWYSCDPDAQKEKRKIVCRGTGHPIDFDYFQYLGTTLLGYDSLVFHWFECLLDS